MNFTLDSKIIYQHSQYIRTSITNIKPNLIFIFQNVQMKSYSIKQHPQVLSHSKMPQYIHKPSSIQNVNISSQTKSALNKYSKEFICQQVPSLQQIKGFYSGAVLLRYEYPMMIVTKTKDIFLKRLKRNKKILTEQGSSDQSKSNSLSRSIQLHTNTFLNSVNSSELSKKTAQLRDELFPEFKQNKKNQREYQEEIHDIYQQISINMPSKSTLSNNKNKQSQLSAISNESLADKLIKLSKHISLNQMIDSEAVQINLNTQQNDIGYLICDFDQVDKQLTLKNYQKLKIYQKQNLNSNYYNVNSQQMDIESRYSHKNQRRSKISSTTPFDQFCKQSIHHEKTLHNKQNQYQKFRKPNKQMRQSAFQKQYSSNNRYNYDKETQKQNPKMSAFYQTKKSMLLDSQDQKYKHNQESYRTLERFRPNNLNRAHQHLLKDQNFIQNRQNLQLQQPSLQRHRSNNVFNFKKDSNHINLEYGHLDQNLYRKNHQHTQTRYPSNQNDSNKNYQPKKRTPKNSYINSYQPEDRYINQRRNQGINDFQQRYVTQFEDSNVGNQINIHSPRFRDIQEQLPKSSTRTSQMNGKYNTVSSHIPLTNQKKYLNSNHVVHNVHNDIYQYNPGYYIDPKLQDKQQKKQRIRQKAAQLLSRVKSQQYLTTRIQTDYTKRYY